MGAPTTLTGPPKATKPKVRFNAKKVVEETPPAPVENGVPPTEEEYGPAVDEKRIPSALEPKVMAPYKTPPGQTPRRVQIERKKRLFSQQKIGSLLDAENFPPQPPDDALELANFDDNEFDTRTQLEWVAPEALAEEVRCQVARYASLGEKPTWADAVVLSCEPETNKYTVKFADGVEESVPRLDIYFMAEDPFNYVKRRVKAHELREHTAKQLLYNLYVDSMPTEDIPPLTVEQINRMLGFALNSKKLKDKLMDTSQLINEINIEYARTMNKIVFDNSMTRPHSEQQKMLVEADEFPQLEKRDVPTCGTVTVPIYDFAEQFSEFSFYTCLTKSEVITATVKVRHECNKVAKMNLFNTYFTKSVRLEDFEQAQTQASDQVAGYLKESWVVTLKNAITNTFKDTGKGWFNVHKQSQEIHDFSKLKKFLTMTRFMMEDSLRFLVEESLEKFMSFMDKNCSPVVNVVSTCEIHQVKPQLDIFSSKKPPLFALELLMKDGHFCYSTDLNVFEPQLRQIFDHAIKAVQTVPQLDPSIMEGLFWTHIPMLNSVHTLEDAVCVQREQLTQAVLHSIKATKEYLVKYDEHLPLLALDIKEYMATFTAGDPEKGPPGLPEMLAEIEKHAADLEHLNETIPNSVSIGPFMINCKKVLTAMTTKKQDLLNKSKELLAAQPRKLCEQICDKYKELDKALKKKSTDPESVKAQRDLIDEVPKRVGELEEIMESTLAFYTSLDKLQYGLPDSDFDLKALAQGWPFKVEATVGFTEALLAKDEEKYKEEQMEAQESFELHLNDLNNIISSLQQYTDLNQVDNVATQMRNLQKDLKQAEADATLFNMREVLFGVDATDYSRIKKMIDTFDPFLQFWTTASNWKKWQKSWMNDPFNGLDSVQVEKDVQASFKTMFKMGKAFQLRDYTTCANNCEKIRLEVEEFRKYCPLITALRSPGMRDRHWEKVTEEIGIDLHPDEKFTLTKALEMGLMDHLEPITKVSDVAGKEYSIETALDKMATEWKPNELIVKGHRETGTYIIKVEEQITQMLDDHIVMTQAMSFSPFKKPFEDRITEWEMQLRLASEILDEWMAVQRQWMYLEPIFSSEDIMQQLPLEGKRFATVDRTWRKALGQANLTPHVLTMCSSKKLLDSFIESNKMLESVQKGLADYLETKRLAFSRFFFLSNDELLQILSQTKNPLSVQPHLRKCFEAIDKLEFQDDLQMTAMMSAEKEKVPFAEFIYPKGNVENWLGEVERVMKKSVRQSVVDSMADFEECSRTEWMRKWPAMVVLAVDCMDWTKVAEGSINKDDLAGFYQLNVDQLVDCTLLVRGKLSKGERLCIGALIVIDVHARDVVQRLIDCNVSTTADFDWVAQLRYYWENEDIACKMVQASLPYGHEYLGNTPRLVVTPLTDRCYMTLMGAMHLNLGGAPAGPAGTGKTETTKDLAKALAKQCVVFNCSDGLDYLAMGKFFKGLASSGAWACFDEFNRIDLEVLSVVAQQILTIQIAIQQKQKRFIFEDTELNLDSACSVFITMNPGYAGRSELPDNLKALFRPCAMMVPDYALIGEISLMSFGFQNGRPLARKMVATFKLCSEQLSAQDHYDYGMRAVKSVITAAGNLKREFPEDNEEVLLLRGLMDVNIPKFLSHDLPLFAGIISDLFPGVKKPDVDYSVLKTACVEVCEKNNLQVVDVFFEKIIQLYEMTIVRHGLMLVGPTGGGKTCNYRTLGGAMTVLKKGGSEEFEMVQIVCLNPKSITMGQLYGDFDEATHEWTDGVLACYMRELSEDTTAKKKWLMFDGPVDAIWIENMNTVLDDNKKLCLVSGEIIQMSATMTMMFEVEDLAVASPATVSRCGMVYMEPTSMGYDPLLQSWLNTVPHFLEQHKAPFTELFNKLIPGLEGMVFFVRKQCKEVVGTVDNNLVLSMFAIMDSLLKKYERTEDQEPLTPEEIEGAHVCMLPMWIFSFIWSIGASVNGESRPKVEEQMREIASGNNFLEHLPPTESSMYDFCFDQDELVWKFWLNTVPPSKVNPDMPFAEIIVPTIDTIRYTFLLDILLKKGKHVLGVGETGTGKTLTIMEKVNNGMPEVYIPVFLTFSARTSANQTQDLIDSKMDKRRKGVFGPPSGNKMIISVDDMNMPQREKYFAQPPIEILRQWMDHSGWYERKPPCAFRQLVDIQFVGAMGPPGGGKNPVSNRFLRHFNFLAFADMSDESMHRIFNQILGATLERKFAKEIHEMCNPITVCSVELYNNIRKDMLPTPAKSHYTFNLRDVARVIQGVLRAEPKNVQKDQTELLALWIHESQRVFADRLINNDDREWFTKMVDKMMRKHTSHNLTEVVGDKRLLFADFLVPGADPKVYTRVADPEGLKKIVEEGLDDYNSVSNAPMKLVMFLDAIEHVVRITRVIRLPLGNALLLGVGGSGRQSLTRIASYLEDYEIFQIEIAKGYGKNEWRDDLKKVLMMAGMEGKDTTFLFTDTQIVQEGFLEDINNILNSGEVPNLWKVEDTEAISNAVRPVMQGLGMVITKMSMMNFFVNRVRSLLHVVLAMSPIGDAFRTRLRMFPSLVNCCTIDWFSEWPMEALISVANTFFNDVDFGEGAGPEVADGVVKSCVFVHQSVEKMSVRFFDELRRFNYVTPTSYLEMLTTFIKVLGEKREEIKTMRHRLQVGLDKLNTTASEVQVMEKELVDLQPVLKKTAVEVEEMMVVIKADTEEADKTKEVVSKQEEDANVKAASAKAIADDAQADLDKALPALDAALSSLKNLTRNDIVEVKALKNPPAGVKLVMEACCIMFSQKPKMVPDTSAGAKPGAKVPDYWEASTKMLADPTVFLDSLMVYDKENIPPDVIKKIQPYIDREDFTTEAIAKVSKACTSICMWARAMHTYYNVSVGVAPKRAALAEAQGSLEVTMGVLAEAKAKLKGVEDKLAELQSSYEGAMQKKQDLAAQVDRCAAQLDRAGKLIGGLGGEKARWEETVQVLTVDLKNVVGDAVVSAGVIAYSGPFTPTYRQELNVSWMDNMTILKLPHTPNASIIKTLADPVKIRSWQIAGLPSDQVSTENGIIVSKARRWPLMIDPQAQANKWIKNMEKDSGLDIIKLSEKDFLRTLSNGVRFGRAVVLENIAEQLDPALEPLLLKQIFKQGGSDMIKMGDDTIPYHPEFRFYITTKLRNPHYAPEVSVKVSLLNFFVTLDGLEDQLLGIVVGQERADLAELKNNLVVSNARMKKELKEIEDKILFMLSNAKGNILDDEELINTLAQSKVTSNEIAAKVEEAEATEKTIDETREVYRPVATRASVLFFCISDLATVDPMYQYSLAWFITLFLRCIEEAEKSDDVLQRLSILNEYFTYSLYLNICRSLFEAHKLMLSLLLVTAILKNDNKIDPMEWRFLLAGPTDTNMSKPNPASDWMTEKVWVEILNISKLTAFIGFDTHVAQNIEHYKKLFESSDAHRYPIAPPFADKLSLFQKLIIGRAIRPDKVMLGVMDFVTEQLGTKFIEPPPFDLLECFKESSTVAPLIFVLSSGADPMADLLKLCEEMRMLKKFDQVSLGQGQGPKAEKLVNMAMDRGMWICLQNCHLAPSWMPRLEVMVEGMVPEKVHKDYRLWLTSMPSPAFPVAILQNGVKMTLEPPKGLKSNLTRSYSRISDKYLAEAEKPDIFRKLLYAICLFHAVIQDRRKFGPLGWNIRYDFTDGDLAMCQTQIKMLIGEYDVVPFLVIRVLCGEVNYGGRVTDDKDRRLMNNLLETFIHADVIGENFKFSPSGDYICPSCETVADFMAQIKELPATPKPEIFGLHENADITCDQTETYGTFATVLSLQPRVSGGGGGLSREDIIEQTASSLKERTPSLFDIDLIHHKYPTRYDESMNTVLAQECIRYNALIGVMQIMLREVLKALKGLVVMSPDLEAVANACFNNQVPDSWAAKAYPSMKPLSSWFTDLLERVRFINEWIDLGPPACFWFSGFFFPQAFITGTMQNFARKNQMPIDTIGWDFHIMDHMDPTSNNVAPQDGCYIFGMFMEGARWDSITHKIGESRPKELYSEFPMIWLDPKQHRKPPTTGIYNCPCYKILSRAGTLSTTGHSTNFVMYMEIPSDHPEGHWIDRGLAMFTQLMF
ncbi:hypothetical protein CYMTET_42830 [Cymbomonas tetramitiformis]|uniref:Dynein heavy chain n=1 Tax=Cymbomonas tetramitiformis TaxID=36881 RepID=A0AAE0F146_9CHLO|nr:hypothetical protein CYMTET_42830 [Cymbomonas tetramitiformis]